MPIGRNEINLGGFNFNKISASENPRNVVGNAEFDWDTIPVAASDITLPDETQIKEGEKYIRYGSMVVRIKNEESRNKFGLYDPSAIDGRQTINRGDIFILNKTVRQSHLDTDKIELFNEGDVYTERLCVGESSTASLEDFHRAFPMMRFINN